MASTKQTVLITGCSPGGIGHSMAVEFHSKGLQVIATARRVESIQDLASVGITTLHLDVDSSESIALLKERVNEITNGNLNYLVNNAGRNYTVPALDIDFDEVQQTFQTNLFGAMRMCQAFAPQLIQAKGTIIQIGSVAGVMPFVFGSVYNASKAALHEYSDTLRVELEPLGVKVVTIMTGGVQSRIARTDRTLPKESYYWPVAEEYFRRVKYSQEGAMPHEAFTKSVVRQVLWKRNPKTHIWEGQKSWLIWFACTFLPRRAFDFFFYLTFRLWKLKKRV